MAGFRIEMDDATLRRRIERIRRGLADATPLMERWAQILGNSVDENFEQGGRPRWKPLALSTVRRKGHARPLIGRTQNLRRVTVRAERARVVIGTSPAAKTYASIHQFGGNAGRNRKVTIPARPFIVLQAEDRQ